MWPAEKHSDPAHEVLLLDLSNDGLKVWPPKKGSRLQTCYGVATFNALGMHNVMNLAGTQLAGQKVADVQEMSSVLVLQCTQHIMKPFECLRSIRHDIL